MSCGVMIERDGCITQTHRNHVELPPLDFKPQAVRERTRDADEHQ